MQLLSRDFSQTDWKKIFANHISNKGLLYSVFQTQLKYGQKTEDNKQMANKD